MPAIPATEFGIWSSLAGKCLSARTSVADRKGEKNTRDRQEEAKRDACVPEIARAEA